MIGGLGRPRLGRCQAREEPEAVFGGAAAWLGGVEGQVVHRPVGHRQVQGLVGQLQAADRWVL